AGGERLAVDEHLARTALLEAAAELRARQIEVVAQDVQQRGARIATNSTRPPVHVERYVLFHREAPRPQTRPRCRPQPTRTRLPGKFPDRRRAKPAVIGVRKWPDSVLRLCQISHAWTCLPTTHATAPWQRAIRGSTGGCSSGCERPASTAG